MLLHELTKNRTFDNITDAHIWVTLVWTVGMQIYKVVATSIDGS